MVLLWFNQGEKMEKRRTTERLLRMGNYSRGLVLPKWWLRLNGNPEVVKVTFTLDAIKIEPAGAEPKNSEG